MAQNPAPNPLRKTLYQRFDDDQPLEPGAPFYEPVYQRAGVEDPVRLMFDRICMGTAQSLCCFSGFRGSGKSTELLRLKQDLENEGYVVLYANALKYLNPSQEVDIASLLLVLAGSFSDALEKKSIQIGTENYWDRFVHFLTKTQVDVAELGFKVGADDVGAELKLNLSTTPTLRQKIAEELANHLGELKKNVDKFFEDGVKAIKAHYGEETEVVFLFDQLEQIRGSLSNEESVIHSVEVLFAQHYRDLKMPYVHMVYTVPPWLKFVHPGGLRIELLPSVRQWNNDEHRTLYHSGWESLRSLVKRRFDSDADFITVFGEPLENNPLLDRLVGACGGHFRDLLLLVRETVLRTKTFPVTNAEIDAAITAVRGDFLPIAIEDAEWLNHIARVRDSGLRSVAAADVGRLARFLDTHMVLFYCNGDEWYDIHPLIREEVAEIVAREAAARALVAPTPL